MNSFIAVVETRMESSSWTAFFTAVTPLAILFSLWVQRIWARKALRAADKAAMAADVVKDRLATTDREFKTSLAILMQTTENTHVLINGQRSVLLKNLALLARNHASMARVIANKTQDQDDIAVARAAELAAESAEKESSMHELQQKAENERLSKKANEHKDI